MKQMSAVIRLEGEKRAWSRFKKAPNATIIRSAAAHLCELSIIGARFT